MKTPLTDALGVDHPIIQAPMGGASCPELAAAVSNAGGLGMLALSWSDRADIRAQIGRTRALTDRPFGVNLVLAWPQEDRLAICVAEGIQVVSFFWGDPSPFVERAHVAGAQVLNTVSSACEARHALDAGVDVVVAQGWEAGGHVRGDVATLPLVRSVVEAACGAPVVAAGGIADGRGLAAVLALGAAGAWIGTRFLASDEAAIHPRYRERLLSAHETDTVHTSIFDGGWPDAPHRVLRNATFDAWISAGEPPRGNRPGEDDIVATGAGGAPIRRYRSATPRAGDAGDIDALSLWAGQGVGLLTKTQPASEIVREIVDEARAAIEALGALI